jgi:hypothetical protein
MIVKEIEEAIWVNIRLIVFNEYHLLKIISLI